MDGKMKLKNYATCALCGLALGGFTHYCPSPAKAQDLLGLHCAEIPLDDRPTTQRRIAPTVPDVAESSSTWNSAPLFAYHVTSGPK